MTDRIDPKLVGIADIFGAAGIVPVPGTDQGPVCTDEGCTPAADETVTADQSPVYAEPEPEEAVPVDEAEAQ